MDCSIQVMSEPLVLVSYLPGEGFLASEQHRVVPIRCDTDLSYWKGIADRWDHPASLVNIEHDLEWTDAQVTELLSCKYDACSYAYRCNWVSTGQPNGVWAHTANGVFIERGDEWAEWSGLGFIKIAPAARIAPLREAVWNRVENSIDEAVKTPWHMHWGPNGNGVPHWHW